MREKLMKFMDGRYGYDQLNKFLFIFVFVLFILSSLFGDELYYISLLLLLYSYYRMFSKKHQQRYKENEVYIRLRKKVYNLFSDNKNLIKQRQNNKIYKCPSCNQKLRIPKGKGKVSIHCPRCRVDFIKRS